MAARVIDLLTCTTFQFTLDTAQLQVGITGSPAPLTQVVTTYDLFQSRDNATIEEIGVSLPYQYCLGTGLLQIEVGWANADFSDSIGRYQGYIPAANEPFVISPGGLFLQNPQTDLWATRSRLYVSLSGNVSMVNNPSDIVTGTVFSATVWAKVGHLLPLVAP